MAKARSNHPLSTRRKHSNRFFSSRGGKKKHPWNGFPLSQVAGLVDDSGHEINEHSRDAPPLLGCSSIRISVQNLLSARSPDGQLLTAPLELLTMLGRLCMPLYCCYSLSSPTRELEWLQLPHNHSNIICFEASSLKLETPPKDQLHVSTGKGMVFGLQARVVAPSAVRM